MKTTADGHGLANRFHRCGEHCLRSWELFECEARNFCHDIVNGGLEAGWGDFGDVIVQLIQRIANRQFGCDFRDGKSSCLGGERR